MKYTTFCRVINWDDLLVQLFHYFEPNVPYLENFKCGAGEGWGRSFIPIVWEIMLNRGKEEMNGLKMIKRREANRIAHIMRRNVFLKQIIEGNIEGRLEVTGRRGRRSCSMTLIFRHSASCISGQAFHLTSWNPLGHSRAVTGLIYLNFLEPSGPLQACNGTDLP